jgi:hypothetical protein
VLLVGILPFDVSTQSFRAVGQSLGGQNGCIPDREPGERKNSVTMLSEVVSLKHPDAEDAKEP